MRRLAWVLLCLSAALPVQADPQQLVQTLDSYPHALQAAMDERQVTDYEIGLGAMQKVRGAWRFKHSERQRAGLLTPVTTSQTAINPSNDTVAMGVAVPK